MGMQIATVCFILALWSITVMSFSTILTDIPKSLHDIWQLYILLKYEHILLPISVFFTGLFIFTKENTVYLNLSGPSKKCTDQGVKVWLVWPC